MQNFILQSEDFNSASWTKQAGTVITPDATLAPNGTMTADLVDMSVAVAGTGWYQISAIVGQLGTTITRQVWLKGLVGGEVVTLQDSSYSLGTKTVTLTNGWLPYTFTSTTGATLSSGLWVIKVSGNGYYAWGVSMANSNWAGDYAKTTTGIINTGRPRDLVLKQNLLTNSENAAGWSSNPLYMTVTSDNIIAPNGLLTMDTITDTAVNAGHYISINSGTVTPGIYCFSAFVKPIAGCSFSLVVGGTVSDGVGILIDGATLQYISTHTTGTGFVLLDYKIQPVANGAYRVSMVFSHLKTQISHVVAVNKAKTNTWGWAYVGAGDSVGVWGMQLVQGNVAGDYQPTTTVAINNPIRNAVLKQNLLQTSDLTSVLVTKAGTPTITGGQLAPDGTNTAFNVTSANTTTYVQQAVGVALKIGTTYTTSIWLKADADCDVGIEFIDIGDGNPAYAITAAVKTTWKQFSVPPTVLGATASGGAMGIIVGSRFALWPTARTITMWHPQIVQANWVGDDCPLIGVPITNPIRDIVLKQNLITYSDDLTNAIWVKSYATITPNTEKSPNGGVDADTIVDTVDVAPQQHYLLNLTTCTQGLPYVYSGYFKKAGKDWVLLFVNGGAWGASFNLTTGQLGTINANVTAKITDVGNGFYRCSIFFIGQANKNVGFGFAAIDNSITYQGNGTAAIISGGQQIVAGLSEADYQTSTTIVNNPIRNAVLKQNLQPESNDLSLWGVTGSTTAVAKSVVDGLNCNRVNIVGAGALSRNWYTKYRDITKPFTLSLWLKRITTSGILRIENPVAFGYGRISIDLSLIGDSFFLLDTSKVQTGVTINYLYHPNAPDGNLGMSFYSSASTDMSFLVANPSIVQANWCGDYIPTYGSNLIENPIRNIVL